MAIALVTIGVHLNRQLHDHIPSTIRAGMSSGVGTLTWITFLPFALAFGVVTNRSGIRSGGRIIVGAATIASAAVIRLAGTQLNAPDKLISADHPTALVTTR